MARTAKPACTFLPAALVDCETVGAAEAVEAAAAAAFPRAFATLEEAPAMPVAVLVAEDAPIVVVAADEPELA